eukprot:TRINITY_DN11766_c0_g1_i1.p1 TRINITY_DN11766_c0_g1~~TRINITY_DN11766_c0_g1_i1.p1  ORF type:complete len:436 (+),score=96.52 TRINITY_DN11766_c0_g1_i1:52-1359(+)
MADAAAGATDRVDMRVELDKVLEELRSEQDTHRSLRVQVQQLTSILEDRERRASPKAPVGSTPRQKTVALKEAATETAQADEAPPADPKALQQESWSRFVAAAGKYAMSEQDLLLVSLDTLKQLLSHCGIESVLDAARVELHWKRHHVEEEPRGTVSPQSASSKGQVEVSQSASAAEDDAHTADGGSPIPPSFFEQNDPPPPPHQRSHDQVSDARSATLFLTPKTPVLGGEGRDGEGSPCFSGSALVRPVGQSVGGAPAPEFVVAASPLRPHLTPRKSLRQRTVCTANPNGLTGAHPAQFMSSPNSPSSPRRESSRRCGFVPAQANTAPYLVSTVPRGVTRKPFAVHNASKFTVSKAAEWDDSVKLGSRHIVKSVPPSVANPNTSVLHSPSRGPEKITVCCRRPLDFPSGYERNDRPKGKRVSQQPNLSSVTLRG